MLLDEPTSGLDSFTTQRICRALSKLAWEQNKTIIATIHQPSSKAFSYCDRLILLADGFVAYQGPALEVGQYFGFGKDGRRQNPCDFFMRELSVNYPKQAEDEAKIQKYTDKYARELE